MNNLSRHERRQKQRELIEQQKRMSPQYPPVITLANRKNKKASQAIRITGPAATGTRRNLADKLAGSITNNLLEIDFCLSHTTRLPFSKRPTCPGKQKRFRKVF